MSTELNKALKGGKSKKNREEGDARLRVLHLAEGVAIVSAIVLFLFIFVFGIARVSGNSMYPSYRDGQTVLYSRLIGDLNRGDVVVIKMTNGDVYIKRVIAVPGDTIDIRDGQVYRNGNLLDEPYVTGTTFLENGKLVYPFTLG
ncbi:MAG: signal peptidase I, partial [Eubacterium sp.]|nr:signal peptidase I [Eubacterium sp.]